MVAVNGYFDGQNYIAKEQVAVRPNQRVIITLLDDDFTETKSQDDAREKLGVMKKFFGSLTHEDDEALRNNRMNFTDRV